MDGATVIAAFAVAVAVAAATVDFRQRRIPNRLTYPAMVAGLSLQTALFGWRGAVQSITGALVFGGIFLLFYMVHAMGAGDVKFATALGSIVGLAQTPQVLFATALSGGVLAILYMALSGRVLNTLRSTFSVVGFHARHGMKVHPDINLDNPKAARLPYGMAFGAGTLYWATFSVLWR
jgi:prepilin peptidase CpaA